MIESLKDKSNSIALVGASKNPDKYGNKILKDLISKGYRVFPINKSEKEIEGIEVFKNVTDLKEIPSIINFVVPPNESRTVTNYLVSKGYDNFWYQPGAESQDISSYLKSINKNFIYDKCIMVETK